MTRMQGKQKITERFLIICEEVVSAGTCGTKKEFAASIGEHPQNLALMAKGSRAPTLEQIAKACQLYGYSPTWLILGIGPKKLQPEQVTDTDQRLALLEKEMQLIRISISGSKKR